MRRLSDVRKLQKEFNEAYFRELPDRNEVPKSEKMMQLEKFANKAEREEIIKTWTKLKDHPKAEDMSSEVGSAFEECDLDEELGLAYEAVNEGGCIYCSFEHSFWIRHKRKLIRVM